MRQPLRSGRVGAPVMTDVARLAGVSHQTVSRVVNDSPNVSGSTRARVLAAMEELGYRRNAAARALVTRRSGTLGLVTFDTTLHGPVSTLYAVERAAAALGFGVGIAVVDRAEPGAVARALRRLQDQSVEGVVALAPRQDAVLALADGLRDVPAVLVGAQPGSGPALPAVEIDQYGGAVGAVRHLLELGHRTVHHLAGPQDWFDAQRRLEGWGSVLAGAGIARPEPAVGDWSPRSGHRAMRELLAADPGLTAVFAANDPMAIGARSALAEAGRRVPEDVSLVGFDDVPEAAYLLPPLTTVSQRFDEAGRRAVQVLLGVLRPEGAGGGPAGGSLVATEVVVRASSAPPG